MPTELDDAWRAALREQFRSDAGEGQCTRGAALRSAAVIGELARRP